MYTSIRQAYLCIRIDTSYRFDIHRCLHKFRECSFDIPVDIGNDKFRHNLEHKFRPDCKRPGRPVDMDLGCSFINDNKTFDDRTSPESGLLAKRPVRFLLGIISWIGLGRAFCRLNRHICNLAADWHIYLRIHHCWLGIHQNQHN